MPDKALLIWRGQAHVFARTRVSTCGTTPSQGVSKVRSQDYGIGNCSRLVKNFE